MCCAVLLLLTLILIHRPLPTVSGSEVVNFTCPANNQNQKLILEDREIWRKGTWRRFRHVTWEQEVLSNLDPSDDTCEKNDNWKWERATRCCQCQEVNQTQYQKSKSIPGAMNWLVTSGFAEWSFKNKESLGVIFCFLLGLVGVNTINIEDRPGLVALAWLIWFGAALVYYFWFYQ